MRSTHYIEVDGKPKAASVLEWAHWLETTDRHVALTRIVDVMVSTVFLGIDHNFFNAGAPILYETMINRRGKWGEQWRYTSRNEAKIGHLFALTHALTPKGRTHQRRSRRWRRLRRQLLTPLSQDSTRLWSNNDR